MSRQERISIITVSLNNEAGLQKTLQSIAQQGDAEYQLIVIDGGSVDGSRAVIDTFSHLIAYWVSEPDQGIYHAMNKGIAQATGDYCLFLNAGDWLVENSLANAAKECTGEDIVYFGCYRSYSDGRVEEQSYPSRLTMRSFFKRTIGHQSTFIKRDLFRQYGTYNESFQLHADYDFWLKTIIIHRASCKYIDRFLCYYDMGGRSSQQSEQSQLEIERVLASYLPIRVLDDYQYWFDREQEMEVLWWYQSKPMLYRVLVFFFNIIRRVIRYVPRQSR
ncbi:glycosyltransferase family 2 protein [Spirosoma rigui]|uniref:glycosyltransferase family 2 protein n=1 Tax=Spirosoma rigui TaxID=564064 RepID=UPI0009B086DD|nr:glycosyltransferase family 2 protein [Spirosoma rigui]